MYRTGSSIAYGLILGALLGFLIGWIGFNRMLWGTLIGMAVGLVLGSVVFFVNRIDDDDASSADTA